MATSAITQGTLVGTGFGTGIGGSTGVVDNAVLRADEVEGLSGYMLQNSLMTIDDSGSVNIPSGQHYKINSVNLAAADVGAQATLSLPAGTPDQQILNSGVIRGLSEGTNISLSVTDDVITVNSTAAGITVGTSAKNYNSDGALGDLSYNSNYVYLCVTAGTGGSGRWVRWVAESSAF